MHTHRILVLYIFFNFQFQMLNEYLTERVYLIEDKITLADILLYVRIHQKMVRVNYILGLRIICKKIC